MSEIIKIRHVGIVTKNLKKSIKFWVDHMGFKIFKSIDEEGVHIDSITGKKKSSVKTVKLKGPNGYMVELLYFKNNKSKNIKRTPTSYGITHIAIQVDDIKKQYKRLKDLKYRFNSTPNITPDGYAKMNYFRAHDNVFIMFHERSK